MNNAEKIKLWWVSLPKIRILKRFSFQRFTNDPTLYVWDSLWACRSAHKNKIIAIYAMIRVGKNPLY